MIIIVLLYCVYVGCVCSLRFMDLPLRLAFFPSVSSPFKKIKIFFFPFAQFDLIFFHNFLTTQSVTSFLRPTDTQLL